MTASWDLVKRFKEVNEALTTLEVDRPDGRWNRDKQQMKDLLACGRKHGEKTMENLLVAESHRLHKLDRPGMGEKHAIAASLFKDSHALLEGDTWGDVKDHHVEQFSAIAQELPSSLEVEEPS